MVRALLLAACSAPRAAGVAPLAPDASGPRSDGDAAATPPDAGGAPTDPCDGAATPNPGDGTRSLEVFFNAQLLGEVESAASAFVRIEVTVCEPDGGDPNCDPVTDATVRTGAVGRVVDATPDPDAPGWYIVDQVGLAEAYELSVERGSDRLSCARFPAPHLHTVSVAPTDARVGEDVTVAWTPSAQPGVTANVCLEAITPRGRLLFCQPRAGSDTGRVVMSGMEGVQLAADYRAVVARWTSIELAAPDYSNAQFHVASEAMFTAHW